MSVIRVIVVAGFVLFWQQAQSAGATAPSFQCDAECSSQETLGHLDALKAALSSLKLDRANLEGDESALQQLLVVAREGCAESAGRSKNFSAGRPTDAKDRNKVQRVIRSGSTKSGTSNVEASCPEVLALENKMQLTIAAQDVSRRDIAALGEQEMQLRRHLASAVDAENKAVLAKRTAPKVVVAAADRVLTPAANPAAQQPNNPSAGAAPVQSLANIESVRVLNPRQLPATDAAQITATTPTLTPDTSLAGLALARQSRWLDQESLCTATLAQHVAYPVF